MSPAVATVRNHRLLALLLSHWETAYGAFGPDRYIRLQRLWAALPADCNAEILGHFLCPIFATDDRQQDQFNSLFSKLSGELETDDSPVPGSGSGDRAQSAAPPSSPSSTLPPPKPTEQPAVALPNERRPLVVQLDECTNPPFTWNIIAEADTTSIDTGSGFQRTAVQLRRRELADHATLDMPATVRATIRQAGMPAIRYRRLTRPPEYLLLVERFSKNDHRAGLFDHFYQILRANDVFVERFFYDGDLRICRNERFPAGVNLNELRYRFANARLLVLGSGHRFISSNTGQLAKWTTPILSWPVRALLTPLPREQWGRRESLLGKIFTLLPASLTSLQFVAESAGKAALQYAFLPDYIRRLAEVEPIQLEEPLIRSLRRHYDPGMLCWIAACAVYPALHFSLTLRLGRLLSELLGQNLVTAENLLSLSRLPWFTAGKIQVEAREELVEYLEHRHPERHRRVLEYLLDLMEKNPPPENSVAWAEHQINLALLKIKTNAEPDEEMVRQLIPVVKRLDRPERRGDFVLPERWECFLEKLKINIKYTHSGIDEYKEKVLLSDNKQQSLKTPSTVLILTPLPIEYEAVRKYLGNQRQTVFHDQAAYDQGTFTGQHHKYTVVVREPGVKNVDMALATEKAIQLFHPQIVLLVGIASGVKDVRIGDILVAKKAYGYESGKDATDGFRTRPPVESFSGELLAHAKALSRRDDWKKRTNDGATDARVYFGTIGAGDKVVAGMNNPTFQRLKLHYNDTLALEMEAIGFATALQGHKLVHGLVIRGISDLCEGKAETDKQNWQPVAAERAAAFAFELLDELDASPSIIPVLDAKTLAKEIYALLFPRTEWIREIGNDFANAGNNEIREIWKKVKPLFIEEVEKLAKDPEDSAAKKVVEMKLRKALEQDEGLGRELDIFLKNIQVNSPQIEILENKREQVKNTIVNLGNDLHIGDE